MPPREVQIKYFNPEKNGILSILNKHEKIRNLLAVGVIVVAFLLAISQ